MQQPAQKMISRRAFAKAAGAAISTLSLWPRDLAASVKGIVPTMVDAAAAASITVRKVRRNIAVLEGSGGNIAVLTGADGKLLVDAGFAVSRPGLRQALASINGDPLHCLINTHWHTDHTDGNEWLHSEGAVITAHENTRKRMSVETRVEGWQYTFPAAPAGALPVNVFAQEHRIQTNNTNILLKYYGPAHTDSDISVQFAEADVFHAGDTWWNGYYPFIDYSTGGSIDGSIRAAEANVQAVSKDTVVIPGHGDVGGRAELIEFRDLLIAIRDNVATLKRQGRSLNETIAAKPTARWDAKWGKSLITPAAFTGLVYAGV